MNRSADSRIRTAAVATATTVAVAAVAGFLLVRHAPADAPSWEALTGQRLLDLFVDGPTPRFDEPEQADASALADALTLVAGSSVVRPGEVASARATLTGILALGGGLVPGPSLTDRLDASWRSIRALAVSGGVPPDTASRSVTAVSELGKRQPRMSSFEALLVTRLSSSLDVAAPTGTSATCPDTAAIAAAGRDADARSELRIQVESVGLRGSSCPARPGSLSQLPGAVQRLRSGSGVSLAEVSAVDDLTVLARLDPDLTAAATDAVQHTFAASLSSYARGERLTGLDVRVLRVLLDAAARVPGVAPAVPDSVQQGAARLVRWRASFPDSVDAGGNVLTTILGVQALRLLRITAPLQQVRQALQVDDPATRWAVPERWLLSAGLKSGLMAEPVATVRSRYAGVYFATVAAGRSSCSGLPPAPTSAASGSPAASAADADLVATAALLAALARCSAGAGDGVARAALTDRIGRSLADGDVVAVWQAAEAACLITGSPPPDLGDAMSRLSTRQILPDGGVASAPGGLADVNATYAYLRLRVLRAGCASAWWSGS